MRRADLSIIGGVALLVLIAAFWFLVLSPKRDEAKSLSADIEELEASVAAQEELATTALAAQKDYDENYHRLVVLGKAVPEEADTPSLLVEVQGLADDAGVQFNKLALSEASGTGSPPAAPPPMTPPSDPSGEGESAETPEGEEAAPEGETPAAGATPAAATTPAAPTEASAAGLPLGATVGPAGLPVMPYTMSFEGGFFQIADFLQGLDRLVVTRDAGSGVRGRLITVDGFSLSPPEDVLGQTGGEDPALVASLAVTTYLSPSEEAAAEAAAAGPVPAAPAPASPAGTPTPTSTATPAATP